MGNNVKNTLSYLIDLLNKKSLRYEKHEFISGSIVLDIWFNNEFYVVQIDEDKIGLSHIVDENSGWDNKADIEFLTLESFKAYLESLLLY